MHTAAAHVEVAGGMALAVVGDVRREEDAQRSVEAAVQRFGGIDVCVNNASAIAVEPTAALPAKKFDLMQEVNIRGTFLLTKACLPYPAKVRQPARAHHLATGQHEPALVGRPPRLHASKYGMTLLSMGWAAEFADDGIVANCLWPETYIATAAVANMADGDRLAESSRSPEIMADAAVEIVSRPAREASGDCHIDAALLRSAGIADLCGYGGGHQPIPDPFLD